MSRHPATRQLSAMAAGSWKEPVAEDEARRVSVLLEKTEYGTRVTCVGGGGGGGRGPILEWDKSLYPSAYLIQRITEAQVQKAVMDELKRLGVEAWINDAGGSMMRGRIAGTLSRAGRSDLAPQMMKGRVGSGGKGLPDICGYLRNGTALFVECKAPEWREIVGGNYGQRKRSLQARPAGKLKPEQREFLEKAHRAGCAAGVVWHVKDLAMILPEPFRSKIR